MLRITVQDQDNQATIRLEGKLAGAWVEELEQCWNQTLAGPANRTLLVDLNAVTFVDSQGRALLAEMHNVGAKLVGQGMLTRYILEEIENRCAS